MKMGSKSNCCILKYTSAEYVFFLFGINAISIKIYPFPGIIPVNGFIMIYGHYFL